MSQDYFSRNKYVPVKEVNVETVPCTINLDEDISLLNVQVISLKVDKVNIRIYPEENLDALKRIIDSKKAKASPPAGIDCLAATFADLVGYKVSGAAVNSITKDGAFGGLLLEMPRVNKEIFFPAEVPHSIGVALIKDADIFVKRNIYELYVEELVSREKEGNRKAADEFGMYI